MKMKRK